MLEQLYYLNAPCQTCGKDNAMRMRQGNQNYGWYCKHCDKPRVENIKKEELSRIKRVEEHKKEVIKNLKEKNSYRPEYCLECGRKHKDKSYYGLICTDCEIIAESRGENI